MLKTVDEYRQECQLALDNTYDQRTSANECERFTVTPGAQWQNMAARGEADWRPRYQFDIISQHSDRWYGEWLTNRPRPRYRSEGGRADNDAELLTNLYRKDESRNGGLFALSNAVRSAACGGGFGALKLVAEYVDNESDESDAQVISFKPVYSAYSTVVFDTGAKRQDKSDARWAYELIEMTEDQYRDQFGREPGSFIGIDDMREASPVCATYVVAKRYEVKEEKQDVIYLSNMATGESKKVYADKYEPIKDELTALGFKETKRRKMKRRYVECSIMSDVVLEKPKRIAGKYIPIIPFYGFWAFVDGVEYYSGFTDRLMDAQRLVNMAISNVAEVSAFSPVPSPYFLGEQVQGHEHRLAQRHLGQASYQVINPIIQPDGSKVVAGPVAWDQAPNVPPATQDLITICNSYVQQQTGGMPQDVADPNASGKAVLAVQTRVDMNTQIVNENIQVGLLHLAEVYRCMAKDVYDAAYQVTTMDEMGNEKSVRLFDVVFDEESGEFVEVNDIGRERFTVVVDTGPSYRSQRQQTAEEMRAAISLLEEGSPLKRLAIGVLFDNLDMVGANDINKFNRREMLMNGWVEPRDEEEEALLEQLAAAQGQQGQDPTQMLIMATAQKNMADAQKTQTAMQLDMANAQRSLAQADESQAKTDYYKVQSLEKMQTIRQQSIQRRLMPQPRMIR